MIGTLPARLNKPLAALNGLLAVGIGAIGAHAVALPQGKAWIATGALYGLGHAVAGLWAADRHCGIALLWGAGALLFSGSLYALALGAPRGMAGAVAPAGGLLMLAGWAWLLVAGIRRN
jgi:uncharacterized membrane protein YgdD (TMEM256/DUF423 family)